MSRVYSSLTLNLTRSMAVFCAVMVWVIVEGAVGIAARADWHTTTEAIMGTEIQVQLWHDDASVASHSMALVMDEMHRIDALMSTYKPDSEVSRVNQQAAHDSVKVSAELLKLIDAAISIGHTTNGAFDITYASVGRFFDFRAHAKPTVEQTTDALGAVGLSYVVLDHELGTVRFTDTRVKIDLGGIAKGHAVESAVAILKNAGVEHAIVTAGGDSRVLGDHRGRPWAVGIRDPRRQDGLIARLPIQDEAISTSGDYERYFEADGIRYHHIIEPRTGDSARSVRSVTIIGPNAVITDALSTGVFVLGKERGLQLINTMDAYEAVIIDAQGDMHYSRGLESGV